MKTNEFIKEAESMEFTIAMQGDTLYIIDEFCENDLASVNMKNRYVFNTEYKYFSMLNPELQHGLFESLNKYARTPIEER